MESASPAPEPPRWRADLARRIKRKMKRRIMVLLVYLIALQLPPVAEWRAEMSGEVGPTLDQLAIDLRKLTVLAKAVKARREGTEVAATLPPLQPADCRLAETVTRGQAGSIQFQRAGDC